MILKIKYLISHFMYLKKADITLYMKKRNNSIMN